MDRTDNGAKTAILDSADPEMDGLKKTDSRFNSTGDRREDACAGGGRPIAGAFAARSALPQFLVSTP
jgi:hypothetical protein